MGLRFRKRIKIFPGLWINLSKSGVSTSIGGKGLTVNLKDGKTKTTVGIPGSGLSYSETSSFDMYGEPTQQRTNSPVLIWLLIILIVALLIAVR